MKKVLLIAEKSSLMNIIKETYLKHRNDFDFSIDFLCQSGHLITLMLPSELDESQKSWAWENIPFHPKEVGGWKYKVIPGQEKKLEKIKEAVHSGNYDFVIHAGDPDQEGELLVNIVLEYVGSKLPVYRFWTNALEEQDVLKALHNMENDRETPRLVNLYQSALARQHLDYLIGMNGTEAVSLTMGTMAPTGRCKTPTCHILYQREKEILNFTPHTDYELECTYSEQFKGVLYDSDSNENEEENDEETKKNTFVRFPDKQSLGEFTKQLGETAKIVEVKKEKKPMYAPKLYKLSALQTEASAKYGYSSDKTLATVQSLYEKKLVSYPRTSCDVLSSSMPFQSMIHAVAAIPQLSDLANSVSDEQIQKILQTKKYVNDKEIQEHGHYALSPTTQNANLDELSVEEKRILEMICRRFLAIFFPPVVQEKTTIITENNGHLFYSSGKVLLDKGYAAVIETKFEDNLLPDVDQGDTVHVKGYRAVEKTTVCPKRYTDGELIKVLEKPAKFLLNKDYGSLGKKLHIGTEATRSAIIKQLEANKYFEFKKSSGKAMVIYPTEKCMQIMERLDGRDICQVDLSGMLEVHLEEIRQGTLSYQDFEDNMYKDFVIPMIKDLQTANIQPIVMTKKGICTCPRCGGNILPGKKGYYCSGYKNGCASALWNNVNEAKITENDIKRLMEGKTITKKMTTKDGTRKWDQKLKMVINEETNVMEYQFIKEESATKKLDFDCPKCGEHTLSRNHAKLFCTKCDFSLWINPRKAILTDKQIGELLEHEATLSKVSMVSKEGKKFECYLKWNKKENKLEFDFS